VRASSGVLLVTLASQLPDFFFHHRLHQGQSGLA
jgi:hypothetical protein